MAKITKTPPLETIDELTALIADVQARRAKTGGEPLDVCFSPFGDRGDLPGWTKQVRQDLPAYEDAGVTWLTIEPHARSLSEFRDAVARVSDEVIAHA
jgi:hypothetical protein